MSLSFKPVSEAEAMGLLPEGVYDFQVKSAEDCVSKKGNPMIKLGLTIWDKEGRERQVTDYLMAAMMFKLKHFCDAVGLEEKYKAGSFAALDCLNKSGKCKLKIEESDGYQPKNSVKDYLKSQEAVKAKNEAEFLDDPLPF